MRTICITLLTITFAFACKDAPSKRVIQDKPAGLRQLALEAPGGNTAVDGRIERLQDYVNRDPKKLDGWVLLGRAWIQKARQATDPGYYRNANACADIGLELKPDNALSLNLKGMVLMNDHRFAEAKDLSKQILAADPDDIMALGVLSDASLELGDFDGAMEAAQRMVDLKPNLPSYARASYLRWLQGDTKAALAVIRQAIDAGGDQKDREPLAWVLVEAAKIFHHRGDLEGAMAGYEQALQVSADYPPALAGKATVLLATGKPAEAAKLAERSYSESALAETAWLWGDAANAAGDFATSVKAYNKVEKLGRQGERRALALFFATKNENIREAVELAQRELEDRSDIYSWEALAWAQYRAGNLEAATNAITQATRLGTQDARLLYHHGAILMAVGETDAGRAKIEAALRLNPSWNLDEATVARRIIGS